MCPVSPGLALSLLGHCPGHEKASAWPAQWQVIAGTQKVQGMCTEITWKPDGLTRSPWPCRFHLVGCRRDRLHSVTSFTSFTRVDLAGVAGGCALGWEDGLPCLVEVTEQLQAWSGLLLKCSSQSSGSLARAGLPPTCATWLA